VVDEDKAHSGQDFFAGPGQTEVIFDTPGAIARVYRTLAAKRRIMVSAAESIDPNGRPLKYTWAVLQGDAGSISIRPLNESGTLAEIVVPYTPRFTVAGEEKIKLETNRIDIGVFAHNGVYWSAPAFVTFYSLDDEERTYDAQGRIQSVNYNSNYVDPMISLPRGWRDDYHYDEQGKLKGWTRSIGDRKDEFNADGTIGGKPVRYGVRARGTDLAPELGYEGSAKSE